MEKKTRQMLLTSVICLVTLCLIVFVWLGMVMDGKSQDTISEVSRTYISEMNNQLQKKFSTIIDLYLSQTEGIIQRVEAGDFSEGEDLREELILCAEVRGFPYLGLYTKDGACDLIYGDTLEARDKEEFSRLLTDPDIKISSGISENGEHLLLLAVDVAYPMKNGGSSDVLVVGVPMDALEDALELDEEGALLFSHIIGSDSSFIVRSGGAFRDSYFERIRASFTEHAGKTPELYEQELKEAMAAKEVYSACATVEDVHSYIYCTHIEHTQWYMLSVMRYMGFDMAVTELGTQRQYMILIASGIVFVAIIILFILYYRMTQRQLISLSEARKEAVRANRAKSEFLSSMSHDIRTPMNGIVGMTAIAQANIKDTARVTDCLAKIALSSKHLLGLINDVLDMSKIESGKLSLNKYQICLRETMEGIVNIVQPQIKAKHQNFDIFIQNIQTEDVYCDSVRLNQVLLNFLSNAIKFTPEGGHINLYLRQEDSPRGGEYIRCHFRIKDSGIGMTPEFQKTLFEKFTREKKEQVDKIEGTGLGMAITKAIVDAMGGTIEVQSSPGLGTEFHVTLDIERATVQETEMVLPPWNMLVVDDDEDLCHSAVASLKDIGINAEWALDGKSAVHMAEKHRMAGNDYQVVLLDWKMPGMDGIETARELRKCLGEDAPILIISAYDWSDIEEEARKAGASGFISKPLFKSNLYLGLSSYMVGEEEEKQKAEEEKQKFTGKRILLAEDNDLNWEIAEAILSEVGFELERAENGQICVEKFSQSQTGFYDIILMDIRMPVMTGYEAAKAIRALDREDAGLPIIAMTADAFSEDIQHSLECGMNDHIAKPIDINRLIQILDEYL